MDVRLRWVVLAAVLTSFVLQALASIGDTSIPNPSVITLNDGVGPEPNQECQFPFVYDGVTYSGCTNRQGVNDAFWCYIDIGGNRTQQGRWGNCPGVGGGYVTALSNVNSECVFPFDDGDTRFFSCQLNATSDESVCRNAAQQLVQCRRTVGCTPSQDTFDFMPRMRSFGARRQNNISNVDDCRQFCFRSTRENCRAFEIFRSAQTQCWIYSQEISRIDPIENNDLYIRKDCVDTGTTMATPTTDDGQVTGSPTDSLACYTKSENMNVPGGNIQSTIRTLPDCARLCIASPTTCFAFDYVTRRTQCWFHFDRNLILRTRQTATGVDHYDRINNLSCVSVCTDTFNSFSNANRQNGQFFSGGTTIGQCAARCLSLSRDACGAYDFNVGNQCYIHTKANLNVGRGQQIGNTHFERVSCDPSTTQPSACVDTFTRRPSTSFFGATRIRGVGSLLGCQNRCLQQRRTQCLAFDFDRAPGQCWIHNKATDLVDSEANSNPGTDHYRRIFCDVGTPSGCVETFIVVSNRLSFGGTFLPDFNTADACQAYCLKQDLCEGVDFNSQARSCFWHTATTLADSAENNAVNQYVRQRCQQITTSTTVGTTQSGCRERYSNNRRKFAYGGVGAPGVAATEGCANRCTGRQDCLAYDFAPSSEPRCFLHFNRADILNLQDGFNVNHFTRLFVCRDSGTASPGVCVDTYQMVANRNSQGGTLQGGVNSVDSCTQACNSRPLCTAFDYNTRSAEACFLHTASSGPVHEAFGINRYERIRCPPPQTTANVCRDHFNRTKDSNAQGGEENSCSTIEGCQFACQYDSRRRCFGFDFDNNINRGFFFFKSGFQVQSALGIDHFDRRFDCDAAPTTAAGCVETFRMTENRHAFNGRRVQANSFEVCEQLCLAASRPSLFCYAFDFNTLQRECFHHLEANFIVDPETTPGIRHAVKVLCPSTTTTAPACRDTYRPVRDRLRLGGIEFASGAPSPTACEAVCNAVNECHGFDYDRARRECFRHLEAYDDSELQDAPDVDNYRRQRVCDVSTPSPTGCTIAKGQDGFSIGGTFREGINTEAECARRCVADTSCVAMDYNYDGRGCYHHAQGVPQQFQPNSCCARYVKTCPGCVPSFRRREGRNAQGGLEQSGVNTLDGCRAACITNDCFMFDYDTAFNGCFLHDLNKTLNSVQGVDNYVYTSCNFKQTTPGKTTVRTTKCPNKFTQNANQHALGGTEQANVRSLDECKVTCEDNFNCYGLDYDRSARMCFHHFTLNLRLQPAIGVDNYVLERCDKVTAIPTPTPFPGQGCRLDITIFVDATPVNPNLQGANYNFQVKRMLNSIVDGVNHNPQFVRIALIRYETQAIPYASFTSYPSPRDLKPIINQIDFTVGDQRRRNLGAAFGLWYSLLRRQTPQNVPSLILIITHGASEPSFRGDLQSQVQRLNGLQRRPKITIVGIGQSGTQEWQGLASPPLSENLLIVPSVARLNDVTSQALRATRCDSFGVNPRPSAIPPTLRPTRRPTPVDCIGDIAFILDSSGSINDETRFGVDNWMVMLRFCHMLISNLNVGPSATWIGLVRFSNKADVPFDFNRFRGNRGALLEQVLRVPYDGGNTNTTGGLRMARERVFSRRGGNRPNVPDIAIMVTDGKPTVDTNRLPEEVFLLRRQNVAIIGVGIGPSVDNVLLSSISDYQFHVDEFDQLRSLVNEIIDRSCAIVKR